MKDMIALALKNLKGRKIRSYLTVLGIVIGITAIIALITLGQGLQDGVAGQFDKLGTRRIFVGPKNTAGIGGPPTGVSILTESDMKVVSEIPQVEYVTPIYIESAEIKYGTQKTFRDVTAYDPDNFEKSFRDVAVELEDGRYLQKGDGAVAVIGYRLATDFFDKTINVKNSIEINGVKFRVVGIKQYQGDQNQDYSINVPLQALRQIYNKPKAISAFALQVKEGVDIDWITDKVYHALKRHRDDENFQVTSPVKIKAQTSSILGVVKWVFVGIAFISLIVGAIGITNSMYTSVLERTRHIGVMKAIGAKNSDIALLFLIESGFLGLIGGIIGVILGSSISIIAITAINTLGAVKMTIPLGPGLISFGIFFSFFVGMIAGLLPAVRASKMQPVDALRYE